jgi:hypothetical protein
MEDCLYRAASSIADYKAQAAQTEPLRWVAGQFVSTLQQQQQQPQQGEVQKTEKSKKRKQRDSDPTSERSGKQRVAPAAASSPAQRSATGT